MAPALPARYRVRMRRMLRPVLLAVLTVLGTPVLVRAEDPPSRSEPVTLRVPLLAPLGSLDPAQVDTEGESLCVGHLVETLYMPDPFRRPFSLVPRLAAALPTVSEDGLTWRIPLRADARFADDECFRATEGKGRAVAASDVVFSWLRVMDAQTKSPATWLLEGRIVGLDAFADASARMRPRKKRSTYGAHEGFPPVPGLRAVDERTLEIRLTAPFPDLGWVLAMPALGVLPPEAVAEHGEGLSERPVGSGPYRVSKDSRLERPFFSRNPTFRTEVAPPEATEGIRGRRITIVAFVEPRIHLEPGPQVDAFSAGLLEHSGVPKDYVDAFVDPRTRALRPGWTERGVRLETSPRLELIYDCFNFDDPVLGRAAGEKGRALRRAMSLALDEEWSREHLYNGRVERVEGPILPEFPEHDPAFVNPWKRRAGESMEQARERARQVLTEAGMPGGKGVPALHYDVSDDSTDEQFFKAFRDDMAKIGLTVNPHRATWQEQIARQRQAKFQITGLAWGADWPTASNFLQLFYGPNRAPGSNSSNFSDARFDELYSRAERLPVGAQRTDLCRQMQALVVDEAVWIFRYRRTQWTLRQPWLAGAVPTDLATAPWAYMAVDAERRAKAAAAPR